MDNILNIIYKIEFHYLIPFTILNMFVLMFSIAGVLIDINLQTNFINPAIWLIIYYCLHLLFTIILCISEKNKIFKIINLFIVFGIYTWLIIGIITLILNNNNFLISWIFVVFSVFIGLIWYIIFLIYLVDALKN